MNPFDYIEILFKVLEMSTKLSAWRFILLVALVAFCVFWLGLPAILRVWN